MLRYKTQTRPGLVALYDMRPGNGAGLFLQPRSPHGVHWHCIGTVSVIGYSLQSNSNLCSLMLEFQTRKQKKTVKVNQQQQPI